MAGLDNIFDADEFKNNTCDNKKLLIASAEYCNIKNALIEAGCE